MSILIISVFFQNMLLISFFYINSNDLIFVCLYAYKKYRTHGKITVTYCPVVLINQQNLVWLAIVRVSWEKLVHTCNVPPMALVRFLLPLPKYFAPPGSKHREKERERVLFPSSQRELHRPFEIK